MLAPLPDSCERIAHLLRDQLCSIMLAATFIHEGKAGPVTAHQLEFGALIPSEAEAMLAGISELERRARGLEPVTEA